MKKNNPISTTSKTTDTNVMNKKKVKTTNPKASDRKTTKETKKREADEKRMAIAEALAIIKKAAESDVSLLAGQAGELLASLDVTLAKIARDIVKTDENAVLWELGLQPVTIVRDEQEYQWIEVAGLDRNARVQLIDNNGKVEIMVSPINAKCMEAQAYFEALVKAGKDLTKAVALRKAVSGRTFRQVWAVAEAQEKARLEKKYAKVIPPMAKSKPTAKLIKTDSKTVA